MKLDESVQKCFLMISIVGEAKNYYMQSMKEARENHFLKADELIDKGNKIFLQVYEIQNQLTQEDIDGILNDYHLLLIHAQDQVMSVEQFQILSQEMNACYRRISDLERKISKEE